MKATQNQEQIAKELCLALIDKGVFAGFSRGNLDEISYNTQVGEQFGTLYQSLLSKIAETETI